MYCITDGFPILVGQGLAQGLQLSRQLLPEQGGKPLGRFFAAE
jgi:hypothetical protein